MSWTSSSGAMATVSNSGLVTGAGAGSAIITATHAGVSGTTTVKVTAAALTSITVTPPISSIAQGTSKQLIATGYYSDHTTQNLTTSVSWASSAPLATVSNAPGSQGLVTGAAVGAATITATLAGISGAAMVTVTSAVLTSITVTPPNSTIAKGTNKQLIATGNFSDHTTQNLTTSVTWASSAPLATVSNASGSQGLVTGTAAGTVTITATMAGISGAAMVTVTSAVLTAITVTPSNPSIANGSTVQLTATGTFSDGTTQDLTNSVRWTSSDAMATVSNSGLVTGTGVGSAIITATQGGVSGTTTVTVTAAVLTSITVTPPNSTIAAGTTVQLTATGNYSDHTTQDLTTAVSWASSAPLATVSNAHGSQGLVTGTAKGVLTITATLAEASGPISGTAMVTVTSAKLVAIVVTPANPSIPNGSTIQLTATGAFSDGTTQDLTNQVSWTSSSDTMATVSSGGLVTGTGVGSAIITATQAGVSGNTTVTVTAAVLTSITVTPPDSSIGKDTSEQLKATGTYSDSTTKDLTTSVTWTSSDPTLATVSNATGSQGLVAGTAAGTATITAALGGISGPAMVTVTPPVLTSIAVTPADQTIPNGSTIPLTATGTFSDGSTQDLTNSVSWTSSSDTFATVNNTVNPGLVTAVGVGTPTITATQAGVSGTTTVIVAPSCNIGDGPTVAAYNAIPFEGINCKPPSIGFEGDTVIEFGDEVALAPGTGRTLVSLKVLFNSLACSVSGHWYDGSCVTSPGTTFDHPITANIYDCSGAQCPGTLLATVTQPQTIPYRPSADPAHCPTTPPQNPFKWFNPSDITSPGGACESGISTVLTFTFAPVMLTDQVLWTVAFNTTDYGPMPIGPNPLCSSTSAGCPYDSLNVGVKTYPGAPYAGTDIDPNGVFVNFANPGFYCDSGLGGSGFLRLDTPCWTGFTPLGEVITKP